MHPIDCQPLCRWQKPDISCTGAVQRPRQERRLAWCQQAQCEQIGELPIGFFYSQIRKAFGADAHYIAQIKAAVKRTSYTHIERQVRFVLRKQLPQMKGRGHHAHARDQYPNPQVFFLKNALAMSGKILFQMRKQRRDLERCGRYKENLHRQSMNEES